MYKNKIYLFNNILNNIINCDTINSKLMSRIDVMRKNKYPVNCNECDNRPKLMIRLQRVIEFIKPISVTLICIVLSFGTVAFFIVSMCTNSTTMDNLNSFVSIVLGIVALTTSIVSMFLSFYSIEKADESDKELKIMLQEMKNIQTTTQSLVSRIDEKQDKQFEDNSKNVMDTSFEADNSSWKSGDSDE